MILDIHFLLSSYGIIKGKRGGSMSEVKLVKMTLKNKGYKVLAFILGIFFIYSFFTDMMSGKLIAGILAILYSSYFKEITAKKDGIYFTYHYFIFKKYRMVGYNQLKEIVIVEARRDNLIFLVQEESGERFFITREKIYEMKDFVEKHSDVKIRFEHKMPKDMP